MEVRILGPVEVATAGTLLTFEKRQQALILGILALEPNRPLSCERLIDLLWGTEPPTRARAVIHSRVSELRAKLHRSEATPHRVELVTRGGGYLLQLAPERVDAQTFQGLVSRSRQAGSDPAARDLLRQAFDLWRGPVLGGWLPHDSQHTLCQGLESARLTAAEDLFDVELRLGRHQIVVEELVKVASADPARERLTGLAMLALHRTGRTAEALHAYERCRRWLADELGIGPGTELQRLHVAILRGDPELAMPAGRLARAASPAAAVAAARTPLPQTASAPPAVPRTLPADIADFTGRDAESAVLRAVLTRRRGTGVAIAAIAGPAGVGKTALAVHWAHRVADRFPDGQLYVDLRGYHPDQPTAATDALAAFLTALGVAGPHIPLEQNERAARYRTEVAGRRMLIVLDNAATVEQVRPLLPGTGTSAVLVTSRDSLAGLVARDGARRLSLDLLPPADAHALLNRLIGPQAETDPDAVATLADLCDRLPLALRIAAELAISRPNTTLADLARELADQQQRLDLLDPGGDPLAAVTAVFSWSMRHLPRDAVRTFRLTGLHPGADLEVYAAAALIGSSVAAARRDLDSLTRAHLLHHTATGRYGMHDLLRAYAARLATAEDHQSDSDPALDRLFDYYLATAAAALDRLYPAESHRRPRIPATGASIPDLTGPGAARAWLDTERPTLLAIAALSATHATKMSAILWRYLDGGHHIDAVSLHTYAYHAARKADDPAGQATALHGLGTAHTWLSQYPSASQHLRQALSLFKQVGDQGGELRAHASLGIIAGLMDRHDTAAEHFAQALALSRRIGDHTGEAKALLNLGVVDTKTGRHESAIDHLQRALTLFRGDGNLVGVANALDSLGLIEQRLGRHEAAARDLEEALALFRQLGARHGEARTLDNLGIVCLRLGQAAQATAHLQQALTLFREVGDQEGQTWALNGLGETRYTVGDPTGALAHHAAALTIAVEIGVLDQQARAHTGLGHAQRALNNADQALDHYERARTLYAGLEAAEVHDIDAHLATLRSATHPE